MVAVEAIGNFSSNGILFVTIKKNAPTTLTSPRSRTARKRPKIGCYPAPVEVSPYCVLLHLAKPIKKPQPYAICKVGNTNGILTLTDQGASPRTLK